MNIYVGNLSREATEDTLREAFAAFGQVSTANVIKDRFSGLPRGFAFVEMPNQTEAEAAINGLNGKEILGRAITVNQARPKSEGGGGGGGRGGRGGDFRR
jgi:RNA recognition motif-containing protein